MYAIVEGLGQKWRPLGRCSSAYSRTYRGVARVPSEPARSDYPRRYLCSQTGWVGESHFTFDLIAGIIIAGSVALIIFGGILRIGTVASKLVPRDVGALYGYAAVWILAVNYANIPKCLWLIITDAFSGQAVAGGAIGAVIMTGIRRAAYSNEAGIGTAALGSWCLPRLLNPSEKDLSPCLVPQSTHLLFVPSQLSLSSHRGYGRAAKPTG